MHRRLRVWLVASSTILATTAGAQDTTATPPAQRSGQSFPGLMNPAISVNGLFLAGVTTEDGAVVPAPALQVQELELQFLAAVDPYFRANVILAMPGGEGIEAEEAYVQLTSIPRLLVTVGKLKEPFGRENLAHAHALLTIDKSLVGQRVFGEEGLNDVGVNGALLLPTPWFSEITLGVDSGANEGVLGSGDPEGLGALGHWRNLFDLSQTTTFELGVSGLTGRNAYDGRSVVGGLDLTVRGHGSSRRQWNRLIWQSELMYMAVDGAPEERLGGLYSTLEGSLTRRFWLGGRFDYVGIASDGPPTVAGTLIAAYAPTEFSVMRLQAQHQALPDGHSVDSVVAQLNVTIGTHPTHSY